MSERDSVSFSGVMVVLWIRNLSLHFAANGGSSFMACSMTSPAPHNVNSPVGHTWRVSTKRTTYHGPRHYDQVLPDLHSVSRSTTGDHTEMISTFEWGTSSGERGTDPGSCGLNFERNRLDVVI